MNNELERNLQQRVISINQKYAEYKEYTPDKLREAAKNIKRRICTAKDIDNCMDCCLEDVFAIVKATARLFSTGNVEVTANGYDRKLAGQYDFVKIDGDKAIYLNTWEAGGENFRWQMVHYDEQILGGIYLHKGYAVEMATGEGKTLVATLPVTLNAFSHRGVHVMTVNDYLSKRDYEMTRPIYMFHGLTVGCIEYHDTHSPSRKPAYEADITFGTNSGFVFDYLYDHMALSPEECIQHGHSYAIIDELDSVLIDEADTPHLVGGGGVIYTGRLFKEYKPAFEDLFNLDNHSEMFVVDKLHKTACYTEKGKQWIAKKIGDADLYAYSKTYQIKDYDSLGNEEKLSISRRLNIQNVFNRFLYAYALYEKDVDYIVEYVRGTGYVVIVDQQTGRTKVNSRWEHGLHTAIEVKENVYVQPDLYGVAVISLKNYFRLYDKYAGMSGTIMSVSDELEEVYGLRSISISTHSPMIRRDYLPKVYRTESQKREAIVEYIRHLRADKRPVLIGCPSIKKLQEFSKLLKFNGIEHVTLDAKSEENEALIVSRAGVEGTITLSTSMTGRGTDIKLTTQSKANGGLAVIGTEMFESSRVDKQLMGRAGRQGDPGSSIFFVSLDDIIIKNLSEEDLQELQAEAADIKGEDISSPSVIGYIHKAQRIREDYFHKKRLELARKDDIIAPHREKFYNERNEVLCNELAADSIIANIPEICLSDIDNHVRALYKRAYELAVSSQSNNKTRNRINVPFSDDCHLFTVNLEISRMREGHEYFCRKYKRQVILQVYDKYWKRLVMYMMNDLDKSEIEQLGSKYLDMKREIDSIILSRMINASIPIGGVGKTLDGMTARRTVTLDGFSKTIEKNQPCPCGSGKKFGECHGRSTHLIGTKRRRF